jgi:hypothetical protein
MLPSRPQPEPTRLVRYWHPRLGGWYHAYLVRVGRKWVVVRDFQQHNHRIAATDIREVAA